MKTSQANEFYKRFMDYMHERHAIYLRRQAGRRWPWTDDPILKEFRFCNVYRELDTVTIWIRENIREPFAHHSDLWFMLCIARRINWPDTLAELMTGGGSWPHGGVWKPADMVKKLDARTKRGEQVYTGAYMITAETGPEHTGKTKSVTTAMSNLLPLWRKAKEIEPGLHHSLSDAFGTLLGQGFAWGPFMTYEVVTDLRHTRYLKNAPDVDTWANAGPGAMRGLNRLYGRGLKEFVTPSMYLSEMCALLQHARKNWPRVSKSYPRLELREIEHTLCEFDKYERVRLGEGRPRSKYHPRRLRQETSQL